MHKCDENFMVLTLKWTRIFEPLAWQAVAKDVMEKMGWIGNVIS